MDSAAKTYNTRSRDFKKGISTNDGRRRREESTIRLRKEKKEENFSKRRNIVVGTVEEEPVTNVGTSDSDLAASQTNAAAAAASIAGMSVAQLVGLITNQTTTSDVRLQAIKAIRRMLSRETEPPVQECIEHGVLPVFVQLLHMHAYPELQFEAAWALTNIASTDYTRHLVECHAIPPLVQLLTSAHADLREQSAWCLGNIAGDGAEFRDMVLDQQALGPILANLASPASLSLLRNFTWTLSNLCRHKPPPRLVAIQPALPILGAMILNKNDPDNAMIDAIWSLSYVSDGDCDRIQAVVDLMVVPRLVEFLQSNNDKIIIPALRACGNIVSGNAEQTQVVMDAGVLFAATRLLSHSKRNIRKEVCWMLSNIAAGTAAQLNAVLTQPHVLSLVLEQMSEGQPWEVRKEAAWVISNMATSGSATQIHYLVDSGAIAPICQLLDVADSSIILLALDALEAILKTCPSSTNVHHVPYVTLVDEAGGIDLLEKLQQHENGDIYKRAVAMIEQYFGVEEECVGDAENILPNQDQHQFYFGTADTGKNHQGTHIRFDV